MRTRWRALSCSMRAFCRSELRKSRSGRPCRRQLSGELLRNHLAELVGVLPVDVAELVVEGLDDVAQ